MAAAPLQGIMETFNQEDVNLLLLEYSVYGDRIQFKYDGHYITCVVIGEVNIRLAKALLRSFRQMLLRLQVCWTCMQHPRTVVNYPCGCFCNCRECSGEMELCSLCYNTIVETREGILLYGPEL